MANMPENETPEAIKSVLQSVLGFLSTYGWTIVFLFVVANLLWSHFGPKWRLWRERVAQRQQDSEYHRNPDLLIARQEAISRARQQLQEQHDLMARQHAEKAKELEEQKRREKIEQWEKLQRGRAGRSSGNNSASQSKSESTSGSLRETYNPLTGSGGGSCSFRPSRRGGSSGGG